jgi:ribosomal protein S12 methylthiotransferase
MPTRVPGSSVIRPAGFDGGDARAYSPRLMKREQSSGRPPVVSLVSLGCAKNEVDSERILGKLAEAGFLIAADPAEADVALVNTCGFIHDAREESAGVLRELKKLKRNGSLKSVVALGCLVERAQGADDLNAFLDAADAKIGFADYPRLHDIVRDLATKPAKKSAAVEGVPVKIGDARNTSLAGKTRSFATSYNEFLTSPRLRIGSSHLAHLKISEGCSNFCKFCSIPYIRGVQVSRPIEDIVTEAQALLEGGAVELSLIAQDTTSYGRDVYGDYRLVELLKGLTSLPADFWLRVMYVYPRFLTDAMLDAFVSDPRICPYIDMPLQHISDRLLSNMGRGMGRRETVALLDRIAKRMPDGAVRTTFIVGYPGETEAEFEELLAFVNEGRFSHVGVFMYSHEPRTPAGQLDDAIPLAEKKRRREAIMLAQQAVSRKRLAGFVGREVEVMLDGPLPQGSAAPKGASAVARSRLEASDVDGVYFLKGRGLSRLEPGTRMNVNVTGALDYDLVAEPA